MGAADNDFFEQAQRAARQIPTAEFLALGDANHYAAHTSQDELLLDAVLRALRANSLRLRGSSADEARPAR